MIAAQVDEAVANASLLGFQYALRVLKLILNTNLPYRLEEGSGSGINPFNQLIHIQISISQNTIHFIRLVAGYVCQFRFKVKLVDIVEELNSPKLFIYSTIDAIKP